MNFASQNLTAGQLNAIVKNLGGEEGALKFLRGELIVQPVVVPESQPEPQLNFIVRVDRFVKPTYPDHWFKKLEHPELECSGPTEYDLQTGVHEWLHYIQKNGVVAGDTIYDCLKNDNALASCLNLQDGLAIQGKGTVVFRKLFNGKVVFLWGSVVQDTIDDLLVPCLYCRDDKVGLRWVLLCHSWFCNNPALRFSK